MAKETTTEHSYFAVKLRPFPIIESLGFVSWENRLSRIEIVKEASELKAKTHSFASTECTTQMAFTDHVPPSGEGKSTQWILDAEHLQLSRSLIASSTPIFDILLYGFGSLELATVAHQQMFNSLNPSTPKRDPSLPRA